ncbi:hypothetical protein CEXT_1211 [Caerostris extrusa]|uniref:Uncharacterized protein n=1 Tax=Caerostris extrusa TaxID=172846 RepID=A0AAV4USF8_CAEEX|nr:hypothetical protein CEXT_1211 [Caerostris extrusa]
MVAALKDSEPPDHPRKKEENGLLVEQRNEFRVTAQRGTIERSLRDSIGNAIHRSEGKLRSVLQDAKILSFLNKGPRATRDTRHEKKENRKEKSIRLSSPLVFSRCGPLMHQESLMVAALKGPWATLE